MSIDSSVVAFADALPWPAMLIDERGRVVHVNGLLARSAPLADDPLGGRFGDLFPQYFDALSGDPRWLTPQVSALMWAAPDGQQRVEELRLCRLPHGACLLIVDQTQQREFEAEAAQTVRLASMGFMLASATHEISNPLTAIHSMVQILQSRKGVSSQALRQGLQTISGNVRRLLAITRKLNAFSRVDAEAATRFGIDAPLEEAIVLLGYDSLGETVEVSHRRSPDLVAEGFAGQLQQVFFNILLNAAQMMRGSGSIWITAESVDGGWVDVSIRDNGPGLDPEHLQKVFEPFFTTKVSGEGSGLGLAISNEIVQEHGGTIWVENQPEGGACFHVRLPLAP